MSSKKRFSLAAVILGCSALAAGTTAALAAADSQPAPSDARITHQVQQKLQQTLPNSIQNIQVQTQNGVVTLSGRADTGLTELKALQVAKKVPGVTDVKNRLHVLM